MTLNKIIKEIKANFTFFSLKIVKNVLLTESEIDIVTGISFEKVGENLYIWSYIQPLIFEEGSYIFSKRIDYSHNLALDKFIINDSLPLLVKEIKSFPKSINNLVKYLETQNLNFEQKTDYLWMKIYLFSLNDEINVEYDEQLISHLNSVNIIYDYQKENLTRAEKLIELNINNRRHFFNELIMKQNKKWGRG